MNKKYQMLDTVNNILQINIRANVTQIIEHIIFHTITQTKKEKSRYRLRGIGFSQNDGIAQFSPDYGRNCHRPFSSGNGNELGQHVNETGIGNRSNTNGLSSHDSGWNHSLRLPHIPTVNGETTGGYLSDSNIGCATRKVDRT